MTEWTPPPQEQDRQPGIEAAMTPHPDPIPEGPGARRLEGKAAIVTGGDSGIGRAVALAFAHEGADVAILYLDEHGAAERTVAMIEEEGRRALAIAGDIGDEEHCRVAVRRAVDDLGRLDVLVNDAGEQHEAEGLEQIEADQIERAFRTNVYSMFFLTRAALAHIPEGGAIVNSASVTAYRGHPTLIDYASTKGAIVAFTPRWPRTSCRAAYGSTRWRRARSGRR